MTLSLSTASEKTEGINSWIWNWPLPPNQSYNVVLASFIIQDKQQDGHKYKKGHLRDNQLKLLVYL